MTKIILRGCNGKMGHVISSLVAEDTQAEIVAGIDLADDGKNPFPVYSDMASCKEQADVVIDFSSANGIEDLLDYCEEKQMPVVLCSTGLSEQQIARVSEIARKTAVLRSANMSLGINLLLELLQNAVKVLGEAGFDVEIVEKHHNQKLDAPSGTALALADSINEAMDGQYEYVFDRSQVRKKREKKELGISAVRGGTIVGDHDVIFAGTDEVITFSHRAYSKSVFAKGAVQAAKFLAGKGPGLYDMRDVIQFS